MLLANSMPLPSRRGGGRRAWRRPAARSCLPCQLCPECLNLNFRHEDGGCYCAMFGPRRQHSEITWVRGVSRGETCSAADMPGLYMFMPLCASRAPAGVPRRALRQFCPRFLLPEQQKPGTNVSAGSHTGHYGQACGADPAAEGIRSHPGLRHAGKPPYTRSSVLDSSGGTGREINRRIYGARTVSLPGRVPRAGRTCAADGWNHSCVRNDGFMSSPATRPRGPLRAGRAAAPARWR
jgi:hypothetical protein